MSKDNTTNNASNDLTIREAEDIIKRNCSTMTIEINPLMILFTLPLKLTKWDTEEDEQDEPWYKSQSILLRMANSNHNLPNRQKLIEISNNILDNPCELPNEYQHRRCINSDMEFLFIYANINEVCTCYILVLSMKCVSFVYILLFVYAIKNEFSPISIVNTIHADKRHSLSK
jgi:hypothetical protein